MKKIYASIIVTAAIGLLAFPYWSLAAGIKTFTGQVYKISGSSVSFSTASAARYSADIGNASLARKNGAPMSSSEIAVGDKIEVKGTLWADNSVSANSVRNMSLYTHNGSFSGKLTEINPADSSFIIQSSKYGNQKIHTDSLTVYKRNGSGSTFKDMELGMSLSVKGAWDRTTADVAAREVAGTLRLVNIEFTGSLTMKSDTSFTVIGNGNVIYGVDITKAKLQNKSGKALGISRFNVGDTLRVTGKHVSGSEKIIGSIVKNNSVSK